MILMPCNRCRRRKACDLRETKRERLKGAGLTVAKFVCPIMKDDYRPGRRVHVKLMIYEDWDAGEATFLGTVMQFVNRRLLIHLDTRESLESGEATANKMIVKAWPNYVEPLDEPDRIICKHCNLPEGAVVDKWSCGCQPGWSFEVSPYGGVFSRQTGPTP